MTTNTIPATDSFSLSRAFTFGMRYKDAILRQTAIYACITTLAFFIQFIPFRIFDILSYLGTMIIGLLIAVGPAVFARDNDTAAFIMTPARTDEKFWFCAIYSLVYLPLITFGLWDILYLIASVFTDDVSTYGSMGLSVLSGGTADEAMEIIEGAGSFRLLSVLSSALTNWIPISTALFVALISRKAAFIKTVITPFVLFFAYGVIMLVLGFIAGITGVFDNFEIEKLEDTGNVLLYLYAGALGFALIYSVAALALLYYRLRRRQA